ncbi:MAG: NAD(P)/FAD-dependent oxidoreductase [Alphaproteobacteria bacterium]|jgi:NADH dehydrogenase|nr:NAD(P)/FAD-dependent oxidoreductase [Alphaproteobacteria bacterium]
MTGPTRAHRIVIAGGGASGLELATKLGRKYSRSGEVAVTLVDRGRTHIWKPLLHAVAAGSLRRSQHELNYLAQARWRGFTFALGEVAGLDRKAKALKLGAVVDEDGRQIMPARDISYDTLVLAIGSVTNDFGTPGAAEYAIPLETQQQAARFNRRLVNACLGANSQQTPLRPGQLSVAIIGAGATGTELAAELHRTVRAVLAYGMDRIDPARDVRIILIEAAERILPALPARISDATHKLLTELGVDVRTRARVAEVSATGVRLADGTEIPAELVVWAAGVKAQEVLAHMDGLETNRINQLVVEPTLQVTRDPDIFAMGDCAACPRPGFDAPVPPRAQAAHQMADHMLGQIARRLRGEPLKPFVYHDFGSLVSLGHYSTVGNLMGFVVGRGVMVEGMFARLMYDSLYKMHEAALHGGGVVAWRSLVSLLGRGPTPSVKLH